MNAQAEEAVQLSEERYQALIGAIAEIVWITDSAGQVIEDQPAWRAFTGQTSDDIMGCGWLAALHTDFRTEAVSAWLRPPAKIAGSRVSTATARKPASQRRRVTATDAAFGRDAFPRTAQHAHPAAHLRRGARGDIACRRPDRTGGRRHGSGCAPKRPPFRATFTGTTGQNAHRATEALSRTERSTEASCRRSHIGMSTQPHTRTMTTQITAPIKFGPLHSAMYVRR